MKPRFRERLVRTVGLTEEIQLLFQISLAKRGRVVSLVLEIKPDWVILVSVKRFLERAEALSHTNVLVLHDVTRQQTNGYKSFLSERKF